MESEKIIKEQKILARLQSGEKLTVNQVTNEEGYTELRSYVCRLIDKGYNIIRRYPDGCNYKLYWLDKDIAA